MLRKIFTVLFLFTQLACLRAQQTYHQLEIIPNQSGTAGELRFVETTGWTAGTGTNYVGFKAPLSIGSNFIYELPNTLPGATSCLVVTTAGVIQYDAGCAGGTSLPVIDTTSIVEGSADPTKELRFEVDGFTASTIRVLTPQNADYTIAGLETTQTFSGTNTFTQNVTVADTASRLVFIESNGTSSVSTFRATAYGGGGGSLGGLYEGRAIGGSKVSPSATPSGSQLVRIDGGGYMTSEVSAAAVLTGIARSTWSGTNVESGWDFRVFPANSLSPWTPVSIGISGQSLRVIGRSGQTEDVFRINTSGGSEVFKILGESAGAGGFVVAKTIVANGPGSDDLGTSGNYWDQLFIKTINAGIPSSATGSIVLGNSSTGTTGVLSTTFAGGVIEITTTRNIIGAFGGVLLGNSTVPWGAVFANSYVGPSGIGGATLNFSCGVGLAIKTLTTSGGIVTGASCGAP